MSVCKSTTEEIITVTSLKWLVEVHGVTMGKAQACRILKMESHKLDSLSADLLPKIRFSNGSSPVLYLTIDIWNCIEGKFKNSKIDDDDAKDFINSNLLIDFGCKMSREQVATNLHVSPITISRSESDLLKPDIKARGRKGAIYLTNNIATYIISGRK